MESELNSNGIGKSHDNFIVNFAQFYQLLLRIAHVVYADLYSQVELIILITYVYLFIFWIIGS